MMNRDSIDGPVNLGNPTEFTMNQLATMVRELTSSQSDIVKMPLPKDDPARRKPDITRARELLGWEPRTTLAYGIPRTIEYFRKLLASG
jgi:UDP-glucuronate decarboxylase